jgi:starch synthase (maltosyl-transferring)
MQTQEMAMLRKTDDRQSHKPRRILYVITDTDVGGAEKCCAQLAMGLDRSCWEPAVCSLAPLGAMAERLKGAGIAVHSLSARRAWHAPFAVLRLTRLLSRFRPALVHTFLFHANSIGRLAARLAGAPPVVSCIRVAEKRYRHHLIIENLTCRLSGMIVCVSQAVADFTRRRSHVPAMRLAVIPNAVDALDEPAGGTVARSVLGAPPHALAAVYVGRLDPQKGVDVLLQAIARAQQSLPHLHVSLAGSGPEQESLIKMARQLNVDSRTHFLGWRDDVCNLLKAADLFVMPSRWEGMPNAVLEAMAAGLPVIATRAEGSAELVRDGQTGKLVAIDDPDELAAAMVSLGNDPAMRRRYGQNGQEVARREFSIDRMIAQYVALYESLLS